MAVVAKIKDGFETLVPLHLFPAFKAKGNDFMQLLFAVRRQFSVMIRSLYNDCRIRSFKNRELIHQPDNIILLVEDVR